MKKLLWLAALASLAQPALAANNITNLGALAQSDFRNLSEDLGSALSYKAVSPAEPLGITGFDIGVEVTQTNLAKSSSIWNTITNGGGTLSNIYVPKIHVAKGLPFGIDIAGFYSSIPTTNISLYGAEIKYAILEGNTALPAVAIRGAFTKLSGVTQLSFDTKSFDVSVSKGLAMFTPYAGVGQVWVNSTANVTGLGGVSLSESFTQSKLFGGINANFGLTNLCLELDKTGSANSTTLKLGFRW